MNAKARELGLTDTHFENAHGLDVTIDDVSEQISSGDVDIPRT